MRVRSRLVGASFHLVLVRPPGYAHADALGEALEYLGHALRACGHPTTVAENAPRAGAHNVIACAHLLDRDAMARLPADTIVLNSEPLGDEDRPRRDYVELLARCWVWDYSHANAARLGHARVAVIPFWYLPELERTHLPRSAGDRLVFYGVLTPHRRALLAELFTRGVDVDTRFGCYGEERDRWMRGALGVLNLHKHAPPAARAFEPLRCFHALINEVPVISEDLAGDPTADPFREACAFVPSVGLTDAVAKLVADRAAFRDRGRTAARRFRALDPIPTIATAIETYLASTVAILTPRTPAR